MVNPMFEGLILVSCPVQERIRRLTVPPRSMDPAEAERRIAAQSAKQIIIQKIREAEADIIHQEFVNRNNSIANGITEATISPARRLPSISTSMKITISPPSMRLVETVPIALLTRSVRSR